MFVVLLNWASLGSHANLALKMLACCRKQDSHDYQLKVDSSDADEQAIIQAGKSFREVNREKKK